MRPTIDNVNKINDVNHKAPKISLHAMDKSVTIKTHKIVNFSQYLEDKNREMATNWPLIIGSTYTVLPLIFVPPYAYILWVSGCCKSDDDGSFEFCKTLLIIVSLNS